MLPQMRMHGVNSKRCSFSRMASSCVQLILGMFDDFLLKPGFFVYIKNFETKTGKSLIVHVSSNHTGNGNSLQLQKDKPVGKDENCSWVLAMILLPSFSLSLILGS